MSSPSSFDWRSYNKVTSVKNQGSCGSSWTFATTALYESMVAIVTRGTLYDLAEQYGFQCTPYSSGCSGGDQGEALYLFIETGIPRESAYPYNYTTSYSSICATSVERVKINQNLNPINLNYYMSLTVEQLEQDLVTYGPIVVGVYGSGSFSFAGPSGLINCT